MCCRRYKNSLSEFVRKCKDCSLYMSACSFIQQTVVSSSRCYVDFLFTDHIVEFICIHTSCIHHIFCPYAKLIVSISIALFAFSTILGWEYYGEKALEYLIEKRPVIMAYRVIFSLVTFVGATTTLEVVWNFSDTMNGLMIIPNLICLLWLNKDIAEECFDYEEHVVAFEKKGEQIDYQGEREAAEDELAGQKS